MLSRNRSLLSTATAFVLTGLSQDHAQLHLVVVEGPADTAVLAAAQFCAHASTENNWQVNGSVSTGVNMLMFTSQLTHGRGADSLGDSIQCTGSVLALCLSCCDVLVMMCYAVLRQPCCVVLSFAVLIMLRLVELTCYTVRL